MGPLQQGVADLATTAQGQPSDLYSRLTKSPSNCAAICLRDASCKAMTYIISQRRCWIKNSVPASAPNPDMVSAAKIE